MIFNISYFCLLIFEVPLQNLIFLYNGSEIITTIMMLTWPPPQSPRVARTPGASNWNIIFIECRCDCWWFRNSFIDPEGCDGKAGWEWVWYNKVSSSHRNHCIISQGRHQLSPLSSVITKYWVNKYWLGDCQARQDWWPWCILQTGPHQSLR